MESTNNIVEEKKAEDVQTSEVKTEEERGNKIQLPKRKYAIVHGYNGHHYCGNQK